MVTAYQKFHEAIRENATKKTYEIYLNQFLNHIHKNYERLLTIMVRNR